MPMRHRFAVLFLVVALLCGLAGAQLSPEKRDAIEKSVTKFMAANGVPGVSIAVATDGKHCLPWWQTCTLHAG